MIATAESVILQITMEPASPLGSGAPLRTYALRKALQRNVVVKTISVREMLVTPPQRTSAHITLALPQSLITQVLDIARDLRPSAVVLEGMLLAELADALIKAGYAVIIDGHNVESRLQRDTDIARKGRLWARL